MTWPAEVGLEGAVGCAILAAGAGRRFGGPKQLATIEGTALLRRCAAAACRSTCAAVAVVLGARADEVWSVLEGLPVERIDNPGWDEGMATSIHRAVAWARRRALAGLLVAVADQPGLTGAHIDALVAASRHGRALTASSYAGILGVPALFPSGYFEALDGLSGDAGARALLRAPGTVVTAVSWPIGAIDVDAVDDLRNVRPDERWPRRE
jgi:molybdenum cofactor cytidylyltransferase